jgi:hypothetical protein
VPHLIETVTSLAKRGVGCRSITEAIGTTIAKGLTVLEATVRRRLRNTALYATLRERARAQPAAPLPAMFAESSRFALFR